MRFLLLNQYYPPDVAPTGVLLSHLAAQLSQEGHEVIVLCSKQRYGGDDDAPTSQLGVDVRPLSTIPLGKRFHHKLLHYGSFYAGLLWRLLAANPKPDVVVALTTPPYLGLLANILGKVRGWRTVDWVMDLYPDVMKAHGMVDEDRWIYRSLQGLQRWSLERSSMVISLGPDMQERLQPYRRHALGNERCIPLWAERREASEEEIQAYRASQGWAPDQTVFLYSGNLGLGHRFNEWLQTIVELGPHSLAKWVFSGRGAQRSTVEEFVSKQAHQDLPIELTDYVNESTLSVHLTAADVHLASLAPHWDGCMVPSKLQGSFAAGRPVLFIGSDTCSLGQWISESGGGWLVPPDDLASLMAAIEEALDPDERLARGQRAAAYARQHFDRATNVALLAEAISQGP